MDSERDIGRIEGCLSALEARIARGEDATAQRLAAIEAKVDKIATTLAQHTGGMRLIHLLSTLLAGIGGWFGHLLSIQSR